MTEGEMIAAEAGEPGPRRPTRRRGPVAHFASAGAAFVGVLEQIPPYRWSRPGLGEWDVRGLAGHTARAITTLMTSLSTPAQQQDLPGPVDYYAAVAGVESLPDLNRAIHARGVEAGHALGDNPADTVRGWLDAAVIALDSADLAALVTTAAGGMRLLDYLPTRTFELVTHTLDLSAATGLPARIPPAALRATVLLAADAVTEAGHGEGVLRALTGRGSLPADISMVP